MNEEEKAPDMMTEEELATKQPIEKTEALPEVSEDEKESDLPPSNQEDDETIPYSEETKTEENGEEQPLEEQNTPAQETPSEETSEVYSEQSSIPSENTQEPVQEQTTTTEPTETMIDFHFLESEGRWIVKVIGGPNTGAEFALHGGSSYLIGSDPNQCDIIFHDMSISRKHAKISVDSKENAVLEDLGSKNGTFIEGQKITSYPIKGNVMVTLGTTTFVLIDRTQDQKTIFAPKALPQLPPSEEKKDSSTQRIQETATKQEKAIPIQEMREATIPTMQAEVEKIKEKSQEEKKSQLSKAMSSLSILSIITVILLVLGLGTALLFRTEAVNSPNVLNPDQVITEKLQPFPAVRFSYNPSNHHLLLIGHVLNEEERTRMLDVIQQLPFIKDLTYNNVVIDEFVWREIDQLLAKNKDWKGITISSPKAGQFILSGFLKKRGDAETLLEYLNQNFAYMNLLEQNMVIEEDLLAHVEKTLSQAGFQGVRATLSNGSLILAGGINATQKEQFDQLVDSFRSIAGIRGVQSQVVEAGKEQSFIDLTGRYRVTGFSRQGDNVSVVINGRILSRGDSLDGMIVVDVSPSTMFLERNGVIYKIDYIK